MNTTKAKNLNLRKAIAFVVIIAVVLGGLVPPITSMAGNDETLKVTFKISEKKSQDIVKNVPITNEDGTAKLSSDSIPDDPTAAEGTEFLGWKNLNAKTQNEKDAVWSKKDLKNFVVSENTDFQAVYEETEEAVEPEAEQEQEPEQDSKVDAVEDAHDYIDSKKDADTIAKKKGNIGIQSDGKLSVVWNNATTSTSVSPTNGESLKINLPGGGTVSDRKLVVEYGNADSNYLSTDTGLKISSYSDKTSANMSELISDVNIDHTNETLTYTLTKNSYSQSTIIVTFLADSTKVYNNEKALIKATLTEDGNTDTANADITVEYITNTFNINLNLVDPQLMKYAKGSGSAKITITGLIRALLPMDLTIDISEAIVSANGKTQTYLEWLEEYKGTGDDPPILFYKDSSMTETLDDNGNGFATLIELKNINYSNTGKMIYYKTSDDFIKSGKNMPYFSLDNPSSGKMGAAVDLSFQANSRGPIEHAVQYERGGTIPSATFKTVLSSSRLTATEQDLIITLQRAAEGHYLQPNSIAITDELYSKFMKEFYLFTAYIRTTRSSNEAAVSKDYIEFEIPENIYVTQIKLPSAACDYGSVDYDGNTYSPGDTITIDPAKTGVIGMTISALNYISSQSHSGSYILSDDSKIRFIGYSTGLTPNEDVELKASSNATNTSTKITVAQERKYSFDPYVEQPANILVKKNSDNSFTAVSSVEKGKSYYITNIFRPTSYPYANPYLNNMDTSKGIFEDPLVYFDIPGGIEVGEVHISGNTSHLNGKGLTGTVISEIAGGKWVDSGGRIVGVKVTDSNKNSVTLSGSDVNMRLEIKVPESYDEGKYGSSFEFDKNTSHVSTWSSNVQNIKSSPSAGVTETYRVTGGGASIDSAVIAYQATPKSNTISIDSPATASVNGYVRTDNDIYRTYNKNDASSSVPKRPAGSKNEMFQMHVGYGLEGSVTNGKAYFIVPECISNGALKWAPELNGKVTVDKKLTSNVTYYYTTNDLSNMKVDSNNNDFESGVTWQELDITKDLPTGVKGIKYEFDKLAKGDYIRMYIPYKLPAVDGTNIDYGSIAEGATWYDFSSTVRGKGGSPAVQLSQTDVPKVMQSDGATGVISIPSSQENLDFGSNDMSKWYEVFTYDDFTENLEIDSIEIIYTPQGNNSSNVTITTLSATNLDKVAFAPGTIGGIEYKDGFKYTVKAADQSLVSTTKPGSYKITYTTKADGDGQVGTAVRNIKVSKTITNSMSTDKAKLEYFYDQSADNVSAGATSWNQLYRSKLIITDAGLKVDANNSSDSVVLDGIYKASNLNNNLGTSAAILNDVATTPNNYVLKYVYTDPIDSNNILNVFMDLTVKYRGSIEAQVKMGDYPVSGASITGLVNKKTGATGNATFDYEASSTTPGFIGYFLTLDSVPAGYKMPTGTTKGGVLAKGSNTPVEFNVSPVGITVVFEDNDRGYVNSISLYEKGKQTPIKTVPITTEGSYTFYPDKGKVFSGEYYMVADIKDGNTIVNGSDFTIDATDNVSATTGAIANADITKTLKVKLNTYDITFKIDGDGSFSNYADKVVTVSAVDHGTEFSTAVTKLPAPLEGSNSYFEGWAPVLPKSNDKVTGDAVYVAKFKQKVDLVFEAKDAPTKVYNDEKYTVDVPVVLTSGSMITGHAFNTTTAKAVGTNAGNYKTTFSAVNVSGLGSKTLDYYYNVTFIPGDFEIAKRSIEVKPEDVAKMYKYNQLPLRPTKIVLSNDSKYQMASNHKLSINTNDILGSLDKAGVTESAISSVSAITIESGKEVNYDITVTKGSIILYVNTMDLGVSATGSTTVYDGKIHGLKEAVATIENTKTTAIPVEYSTDGVNYTKIAPTFTDAGTYTVYVATSLENFATPQAVTATVNITERPMTITANSDDKVYDGTSLSAKGKTYSGLVNGETLTTTYKGSITNKGTTDAEINTYKVTNSAKKDTTKNYKVTLKKGTLKVSSRPVTVVPNDATKTYDGTALKATSVKVSQNSKYKMLKGDSLTNPTFSTSITNVGSTKVKATSVKVNGKVNDNYAFSSETGTLTITEADDDDDDDDTPVVVGQTANPGAPTTVNRNFDPTGGDGGVLGTTTEPTPDEKVDTKVPSLDIGPDKVPLYGTEYWALINLILTIAGIVLAILISIIAVVRKMKRSEIQYDEQNDRYYEENKKSRMLFMIGAIVLALGGLVIFLLTQDLTKTMALTDNWTIVNIIVFVAEAILAALAFRTKTEEVEFEDDNYFKMS